MRDPRKLAAYRKRYPLTDFIDLARTPRANAAANPASVLAQDPLALVRDYMFEAHGDRGCPLVLLLSFADLLADGDWVDRLLRYAHASAWQGVWLGHALMRATRPSARCVGRARAEARVVLVFAPGPALKAVASHLNEQLAPLLDRGKGAAPKDPLHALREAIASARAATQVPIAAMFPPVRPPVA